MKKLLFQQNKDIHKKNTLSEILQESVVLHCSLKISRIKNINYIGNYYL